MAGLRQSPHYGQYLQSINWQTIKLGHCQAFVKKIPFLPFSIIKVQRPEPPIPFGKINQLARKCRAFYIKIEPRVACRTSLTKNGYRRDSWPLLPTKTIQIDLTKSEKELHQEMKKKARYCLRRSEKLKVQSTTLTKFYPLYKKFGKGYVLPQDEFSALAAAFFQKALLLTVCPPAGGLILIHDQTAYYYCAFTSPAGRKNFSQYQLVWQAIKRTKKMGCRIFDFEGIADSRYRSTRKWQGFSRFKKSFGGTEITFPGSFSRWRLFQILNLPILLIS